MLQLLRHLLLLFLGFVQLLLVRIPIVRQNQVAGRRCLHLGLIVLLCSLEKSNVESIMLFHWSKIENFWCYLPLLRRWWLLGIAGQWCEIDPSVFSKCFACLLQHLAAVSPVPFHSAGWCRSIIIFAMNISCLWSWRQEGSYMFQSVLRGHSHLIEDNPPQTRLGQ